MGQHNDIAFNVRQSNYDGMCVCAQCIPLCNDVGELIVATTFIATASYNHMTVYIIISVCNIMYNYIQSCIYIVDIMLLLYTFNYGVCLPHFI